MQVAGPTPQTLHALSRASNAEDTDPDPHVGSALSQACPAAGGSLQERLTPSAVLLCPCRSPVQAAECHSTGVLPGHSRHPGCGQGHAAHAAFKLAAVKPDRIPAAASGGAKQRVGAPAPDG